MLQGQHVTIGRAPDNDIVISSKIVSSHHAVLDWYDGIYNFSPLPDITNPVLLRRKTACWAGRPEERLACCASAVRTLA